MKLAFILLGFFCIQLGFTQEQSYIESIKAYQDTTNAEFKNPESSPLKPEDLKNFKGLPFFPIKEEFRVIAKVNRTPDSKSFKMKTTTSRTSISSKYADLVFEINGVEFSLEVYQDHALMQTEEYKDYLFLPFLDKTNGESSYSGGRYISLSIPDGDSIEIDFNKAYNPYCAYNDRYSCPIVPRRNKLDVEVKAGVMYTKPKE